MTDETKILKKKLDIVFFKSLQLNKDDRASVMSNFIGRLESTIENGKKTIRLNDVIDKIEGSIDSYLNKEKNRRFHGN